MVEVSGIVTINEFQFFHLLEIDENCACDLPQEMNRDTRGCCGKLNDRNNFGKFLVGKRFPLHDFEVRLGDKIYLPQTILFSQKRKNWEMVFCFVLCIVVVYISRTNIIFITYICAEIVNVF